MKLAPREISAFLKNPAEKVRAVLIYGPDAGLVSERAKQIGAAIVPDLTDPFNVVEFTEEKIKSDPPALNDELQAMSFTGGRRLIMVRDASDKIAETVESCLNEPFSAYLILSAGELAPRSSLRSLFEKHTAGAAVPCYNDEGAVLQEVICQALSKAGIRFDQDVVSYLCQQLGNDRRVTLNEIDKLITFAGESQALSLDEVMLLVGDNHEATLDECCIAIAGGNHAEAEKALSRLMSEGVQAVVIVRALQRYFQKLHMLRGLCMQGLSSEQAIAQLRPPVFFKMQPVLKRHLERWQMPHLIRALNYTLVAERMAKTTSLPQESICRFLAMKLMGKSQAAAA